jgi:glucose/arabinose dehydrogenase
MPPAVGFAHSMRTHASRALVVFACLAVFAAKAQPDWPQLKFTQVAAGFSAPTHVTSARDGSDRLFVVEQPGRIKIIQSNAVLAAPFLDITNRVGNPFASAYGLLSVAFPADYATSHCFYVYYSRTNDVASVISRFFVSTNANQADAWSEQQLLVIPLDTSCSTVVGGQLAFGPDGYLYISTGDEALCDQYANAQQPDSLWGKILRIDVGTGTNSYAIPPSNPFLADSSYQPEIWDLGFRNPWRFSFDRLTGEMFIGDVGQSKWEEVDYEPAGSPGGHNFGWSVLEGNQMGTGTSLWSTNAMTPPIVAYPHTNGPNSSITGGFVYRGPNAPRMNGIYFFGDFIGGTFWGLARVGTNWVSQEVPVPKHFISSFGEDESGQLYLVDYILGKVYRIEDSGLTGPPVFDPGGGVSATDTIAVTTSSPGATIHYTTNGATPVETDPVVVSNAVTILSGTTLTARAFRADLQPSTVTTASYVLQAGTPAFSPRHGPVTNGTALTITCSTTGAVIRYTFDSSDPSAQSAQYTAPLSIGPTSVVSARAFKSGFNDSAIQRVYFSGATALTNVVLVSGGFVQFQWFSQTGFVYQVQGSSNLVNWTNIAGAQAGTEAAQSAVVQASGRLGYFRMRVQ